MDVELLTLLEDVEIIADDIKTAEDNLDAGIDAQEAAFLEMANIDALTLEGVQVKARALSTASFISAGAIDPPSSAEGLLLLGLIRDLLALT